MNEVSDSNASGREKDQSNFLEFTPVEKFTPSAPLEDDISDTLCLTIQLPYLVGHQNFFLNPYHSVSGYNDKSNLANLSEKELTAYRKTRNEPILRAKKRCGVYFFDARIFPRAQTINGVRDATLQIIRIFGGLVSLMAIKV